MLFSSMNINTSLIIFFLTGPEGGGLGCLHIKFVIVSLPFLPVTVKLISSGQTVKMTSSQMFFSEFNCGCREKNNNSVLFNREFTA